LRDGLRGSEGGLGSTGRTCANGLDRPFGPGHFEHDCAVRPGEELLCESVSQRDRHGRNEPEAPPTRPTYVTYHFDTRLVDGRCERHAYTCGARHTRDQPLPVLQKKRSRAFPNDGSQSLRVLDVGKPRHESHLRG